MKKNRLLSWLLIMVIISSMTVGMQTAAWAAAPGGDFTFDSGTGTITGYTGSESVVAIPASIGGVAVKAIGEKAFFQKYNLTEVTIPASVESIGDQAFKWCWGMKKVVLSEGLKTIGKEAFYRNNITEITIPASVESVGDQAFGSCSELSKAVLNEGMKTIGEKAFQDCDKLKSIELPGSVVSLGNGAFESCDMLEKAVLAEGLETIGEGAFNWCQVLKGVSIPASVKTIGAGAFYSCKALSRAVFKGGEAPSLGDDAFAEVFEGFEIFYPASATGYSELSYNKAAYDINAAYTLSYNANGADSGSLAGTISGLKTGSYAYVEGQGSLTKANCRFDGWSTSADGSGERYEGDSWLFVCGSDVKLYAVWTHAYKVYIDEAAARHCQFYVYILKESRMKSGTLAAEGETVLISIGPDKGWHYKLGSLKYLDGSGEHIIKNIGDYGCGFVMPASEVTVTARIENTEYDFDESTGTILGYYGDGGNIVIPSEIDGTRVKVIGADAFWVTDTTCLTSVIIPEGVTEIQSAAFFHCKSLKGVTLPESLEKIDETVFKGCSSLESIRIPDKVNSIGQNAFAWCSSLKTVYFEGDAPESVHDSVFEGVPEGLKILYNEGSEGFDTAPLNQYKMQVRQSLVPADAVQGDIDALNIIYGFDDTANAVSNNLYLPVTGAVYGSDISWASDKPEVISSSGAVTRPDAVSSDVDVTVTAKVYNSGASDIKSFALKVLKLESMTYTVTFDKNMGDTEANPKTIAVAAGGNVGTLPAVPVRSGYSFNGWNTKADGTGTTFTAGTAVNGDITVYAQWTAVSNGNNNNPSGNGNGSSGGGNSSGGGGSTGGNQTNTPTTTPVVSATEDGSGITGTTTTEAKTDSSGKAVASVTENQVAEAVSKAVEAAAKKGNDTAVKVEIKVNAPADAKAVEISIPKAAVEAVAGKNADALTVSTPVATITFDQKSLKTISGEADGDVKITAAKVETAALSEEAKQTVGDRPVYSFSVTSGDKTISQFGGSVTVSVPYTPKAGEDTNAIVIYYINAQGKPEVVSNCSYNPETGSISFTTSHFSQYAVGYNPVSFTDVAASDWFSKAIGFIAARKITTGTGNGNYSPDAKLTRGEFIVMLLRAYDIAPDTNTKDNFADAGNTYYTGYLAAAKRLGISEGIGNNMFAPGKQITRQEMFTLLYNVLKGIGRLPEGTESKKVLSDFSDTADIASWAKDAMTFFMKTGTIGGSGGKLSPTATTTRAEMAQVLYNLMKK